MMVQEKSDSALNAQLKYADAQQHNEMAITTSIDSVSPAPM
jgi:hypothetical protein